MNMDLQLITKMQFLASQLASWILDAFGQIHFREGVILVTETKQFFTEEACSGIRSLFSSLAAISIFGVMQNYPWWRHMFNLLQTTIWVIVGNAIRIAIVVYVADNWNEGIATGTSHEILGLVMFILIFLLSLSTDRGINAWQMSKNAVDDFDEELNTNSIAKLPQAAIGKTRLPAPVNYTFVSLFVLVTLFSFKLVYSKTLSQQPVDVSNYELLASTENELPNKIAGWQIVNFQHIARDESSLLAPESYIWTYSKNDSSAQISLDGPYPGHHRLNVCYSGIGWNTKYQDKFENSASPGLTKIKMVKSFEHGVVLYTAYDAFGELVAPPLGGIDMNRRLQELLRNIRIGIGIGNTDGKNKNYQLPISQIQLVFQGRRAISDEDEKDLETLFLESRNILLKTDRFNRQK